MGSEQKRAFLAVVLSGVVLFTWQFFFAPKTKKTQESVTTTTATTSAESKTQSEHTTTNSPEQKTIVERAQSAQEQTFTISKGENTLSFTNTLKFTNLKSSRSFHSYEDFIGGEGYFQILAFDDQRSTYFNFSTVLNQTESSIELEDKELGAKLKIAIDEKENFSFALNSTQEMKYRIVFKTTPKSLENKQERHYIVYSNKVERPVVGSAELYDSSFGWLGLDFNYQLLALSFPEKVTSLIRVQKDGTMIMESANKMATFNTEIVYAKKNYDDLVALGNKLELAVDFGFWGILAVPILRGLQFFYEFIPNYGISIIFLTIIIRLITFPLQYKSFKSMKKMQLLQPELAKLKEKYKDEPQKLQQETMTLFKKSGANPLGGCLPMLMQMPVFFAFYKVLYSAVELVDAPFIGWIHDLSIKDPYFILPVLMTVTMFLQQKLTPSASADPSQQKIMMAMPIVFGFIMKDLPAGLVLYIFISTLLGILQQLFVNKSPSIT